MSGPNSNIDGTRGSMLRVIIEWLVRDLAVQIV